MRKRTFFCPCSAFALWLMRSMSRRSPAAALISRVVAAAVYGVGALSNTRRRLLVRRPTLDPLKAFALKTARTAQRYVACCWRINLEAAQLGVRDGLAQRYSRQRSATTRCGFCGAVPKASGSLPPFRTLRGVCPFRRVAFSHSTALPTGRAAHGSNRQRAASIRPFQALPR